MKLYQATGSSKRSSHYFLFFLPSEYKTKITPFYIQCISPELNAMRSWNLYSLQTKLQACGIFHHPIPKKKRKQKKIKQTLQWCWIWIFALVRSRRHHHTLLSHSFFSQIKNHSGLKRNIWKLVAHRVTQHFIKREAIPNHSSLFSFL